MALSLVATLHSALVTACRARGCESCRWFMLPTWQDPPKRVPTCWCGDAHRPGMHALLGGGTPTLPPSREYPCHTGLSPSGSDRLGRDAPVVVGELRQLDRPHSGAAVLPDPEHHQGSWGTGLEAWVSLGTGWPVGAINPKSRGNCRGGGLSTGPAAPQTHGEPGTRRLWSAPILLVLAPVSPPLCRQETKAQLCTSVSRVPLPHPHRQELVIGPRGLATDKDVRGRPEPGTERRTDAALSPGNFMLGKPPLPWPIISGPSLPHGPVFPAPLPGMLSCAELGPAAHFHSQVRFNPWDVTASETLGFPDCNQRTHHHSLYGAVAPAHGNDPTPRGGHLVTCVQAARHP